MKQSYDIVPRVKSILQLYTVCMLLQVRKLLRVDLAGGTGGKEARRWRGGEMRGGVEGNTGGGDERRREKE